jgi:glycerol-3-phosphate dehydrogenase
MSGSYDVVVIGAGINGAGVAQAAAAAGYSVLVLEKTEIAGGTSGRSSKLIHGGLRYLETAQFRLVRESLRERALLLHNAPDIVHLKAFYIPVYLNTRRRPWQLRAGLSLYAVLAGLEQSAFYATVPKSRWGRLDGLTTTDLQTVFCYHDAQTDDRVLTKAVIDSAVKMGAEVALPATFKTAQLHDGGCTVEFTEKGGRSKACSARLLVNAGGPWVNDILSGIEPVQQTLSVEFIRGSHITLPEPTSEGVYYIESPRDGRAVFVMPWHDGTTLVGTTETQYYGDPDEVLPLRSEKLYLLHVLKHYFPRFADVKPSELIDAFAGIRVLMKKPGHAFHHSREVVLRPDRKVAPRLISIYGGKLTTYRATAEKVMRMAAGNLPERPRVADTETLRLQVG